MTIVQRKEGIIIIDPLISFECAAATSNICQTHHDPEKQRRVTGMICSHSHGDHYMGAQDVLPPGQALAIPIIAPEGFMEAVMSESVIAGPAMRQRAAFMYGRTLPRRPQGYIGVGLGMGSSIGSTSLIPPNLMIQNTGEEHVVDGVRIVFQMVPETEALAEINFHFPGFQALCIPEIATYLTLRGAQVRDAKAWSRYLDEAIVLFGSEPDVVFGSHNWPTWGRKELINKLAEQRDMYAYLHDQTVRMMNLGGVEAVCAQAEDFIQRRDLRFAATLLHHAVAAYSEISKPKTILASAYKKLAHGAENATWRNLYLTGAQRLRTRRQVRMVARSRTLLEPNPSVEQWFSILSVQVNGERAAEKSLVIDFNVTDANEKWRLLVSNGVLIHRRLCRSSGQLIDDRPDLQMVLSKQDLLEVLRGNDVECKKQEGRREAVQELLTLTSVSQGSARGPSQL
ncbi:Metallo-hydrolase/oxidoreductase [Zopfia rhizophila CBS 207.26]|uniref:Metallo-hydrolase/oxidoreductase n=1 Tax=Zopfia rhizophila CBS 207.26 TaxID=1314779 RepID=A0A6A6EQY7_9PEZI|nr:Metallo-hydrolase/oxidoreductase [Zopfia rhizophila CBS 207.26]